MRVQPNRLQLMGCRKQKKGVRMILTVFGFKDGWTAVLCIEIENTKEDRFGGDYPKFSLHTFS